MTDNEIISQASEEQFNVACDATDASKNILSEASVIKALEHCKVSNCLGCPYHTRVENCLDLITPNALDLINRQKAEVERLQTELVATRYSENAFKEENRRLIKLKKADAIKEFAERLKTLLHMPDNMVTRRTVYTDEIDNLVAEMTEQKNEGKE